PLVLAGLIFLTSFILEDAATTAAALLAANNILSVEIALISILMGVIVGDLGLYAIGYWAKNSKKIQSFLVKKGFQVTEKFLRNNMISSIIIARFLPGMRAPTYIAMGLFSLNFRKFSATVIGAVGIWIILLFTLIYKVGEQVMDLHAAYQWSIIACLIIFVFFIPRLFQYMLGKFKK
ncbi:MAG: VTT domain-containing protein, partial [Pseudomonadota bacterium]